jgi:hypothetical protein
VAARRAAQLGAQPRADGVGEKLERPGSGHAALAVADDQVRVGGVAGHVEFDKAGDLHKVAEHQQSSHHTAGRPRRAVGLQDQWLVTLATKAAVDSARPSTSTVFSGALRT